MRSGQENDPSDTDVISLRRHNSFLKFWAGQTISMMGSSVTALALPLTAIYSLDAGAAQLGLLNAASWLPYVVLGLLAGAWGDRHRRRRVMIIADLGRFALLCLVVVLALTDTLNLPVLYVAVFGAGILTMLFDISYNAYVPTLVRRDLLVQGNSRLQASSSVAAVAGPGIGGLLVQVVTAPVALLADALSFIGSAICLLSIREPEPKPVAGEPGQSTWVQIRAGLSIVGRHPLLRGLVGVAALYNLFAAWMMALLVLFGVRELGLTAGTLGLASSVGALGAVAGSLAANRLSGLIGVGRAVLASVVLECLALLGLPFIPGGHPTQAVVLLSGFLALSGMGTAISSIVATSIRQVVTPPGMIGRMTATYKFISYGVVSLGALCGGFSGQWLGVRHGMLVGGIGLLSTIVWTAFSAVPGVKQLPEDVFAEAAVPEPAGAPRSLPEPGGPESVKPLE